VPMVYEVMLVKERTLKHILIGISMAFLTLMLILPLVVIGSEALSKGWNTYLAAITDPFARKAMWLTLEATLAAVICNTVFGLAAAWLLTRFSFPGKNMLSSLIDLPFAISPVIAGLVFIMMFGRISYLHNFLMTHHLTIVFAAPGIILATIFVTFPFVAREIIPMMNAQGKDEEEAATTMGAGGFTIFRRITLPKIKWGLMYGVILCTARAMGEFGAVSVVSGHIRGKTTTLPLHIEILYNEYNFTAAFAVASILVLLAVILLVLRNFIEWRSKKEA